MPDRSSMPRGVPSAAAPATAYACALLTTLVSRGVRHIVLSPGSRSQALALVAAELERAGLVRLHVRIDERVAGFLALGIGVETGTPAAIITTSGTATAELHPAVLEAHHSSVPLVVITADRPVELRGVRANQTTVQSGLYGDAVRFEADVPAPDGTVGEADAAVALARDAVRAACGVGTSDPGPVHLNLAFREPLSGVIPSAPELAALVAARAADGEDDTDGPAGPSVAATDSPAAEADFAPVPADRIPLPAGRRPISLAHGPRTVVIAGHGAGGDAEELAHAGGWPLLAEATSGSRYGRELIVDYRALLREPELGGRIERAVVFGHPTLSREVPALLQRDGVKVVVVAPRGAEVVNPGRRAIVVASAARIDDSSAPAGDARAWLGSWVTAGRALREADASEPAQTGPDVVASRSLVPRERIAFARTEYAIVRAPVTRRMLVDTLWRFTWPHDRLVIAASRLIRDADANVPGKKIRVHANRGLAGIDGTIATAVGIALTARGERGRPSAGTTRVLLGDLALLHDVGALLFGAGEDRPALQVIVGNDGGGTIFDSLEVAASAAPEAFERVMYTPQQVDLAALAAAYGWEHTVAATHGALDQALSAPSGGLQLIEVPLSRE